MFTIFKNGMRLRMRPLTETTKRVLTETLCYLKKQYLPTKWQQEEFGSKNNPYFQFFRVECFGISEFNDKPQLYTNAGYLPLIQKALKRNGIKYQIIDRTPPKAMYFEPPLWDVLKEYDLRPRQEDALRAMLLEERGRLTWATGTGKSAMIEMICRVLPKSRIVVTTKFNDTLETIYSYIRGSVAGCGIYSGKTKQPGRRVTCVSIGCMNYALNKLNPHIIIGDEIHELATPSSLEALSRFRYARMFGLTANEDDRPDNSDFELQGIFGDVQHRLSYQEGVDLGMVVPIEVHWRTVEIDEDKNPARNRSPGVPKSRWGLWRNKVRNKMIAEDAKMFPGEQVLITVKTVEHAAHLKKLLPDFTLVYGSVDDDDIDYYIRHGMLPEGFKPLSKDDRARLRKRFELGKLKKVIATTVWNRGVNFRKLGVLIRTDGGSSPIDATQITGRLSRTNEKTGKTHGILIDYDDEFDKGLGRRTARRRADYAKHKWRQLKEGQEGHFRTRKSDADTHARSNGRAGKGGVHVSKTAARKHADRTQKQLFPT